MTGHRKLPPSPLKHRLILALECREAANDAAKLRSAIESPAPFRSLGEVVTGIVARLLAQRTGNAA